MALTVNKRRRTMVSKSDQGDVLIASNNGLLLAMNQCFSAAGTAIATTTTKVKTANTITYLIDGVFKSKAATDNFWTLTGSVLSAGQVNKYLLYIDSAGAASIGESTPSTTAAGVKVPVLPQSKSVVGYVTVTVNSSTFTPGTTALSAGTITVTYTDGIPADYFVLVGDSKGTVFAVA